MDTVITIVVFGVVGLSGLIAIGVLFRGESPHDQIGAGGLDVRVPPAGASGTVADEPAELREDDIRQMLEARNARRRRRGEPEADVDAELRALLDERPAEPRERDPEVEQEARAIVAARNARRRRRGEPEGDVEAEVAELLDRIDPR